MLPVVRIESSWSFHLSIAKFTAALVRRSHSSSIELVSFRWNPVRWRHGRKAKKVTLLVAASRQWHAVLAGPSRAWLDAGRPVIRSPNSAIDLAKNFHSNTIFLEISISQHTEWREWPVERQSIYIACWHGCVLFIVHCTSCTRTNAHAYER